MTNTQTLTLLLSLLACSTFAHHACMHDDKALHFTPSWVEPTMTKSDDGGSFHIQVEFIDPGVTVHCNQTGDEIGVYDSPSATTPYICREEDVLTAEKETYMRNLILDAVDFWEHVITLTATNQLELNFVENSTCYFAEHTMSVESTADYVLYVAFQPTSSVYDAADSTLAWALACSLSSASVGSFHRGRPLAGHLNMGPSSITGTTSGHYARDLDVAKHELAHALGFASSQYPNFLNASGLPYPDGDFSFESEEFGKTVTKIRSPNVLAAAREHFDCPTLDGAEIEDGGGSGTALSHWEARVFNTEFMIGYIKDHMYVSEMTLALFDDMGWYTTNRTYAEEFIYGQGEGCSFVNESCATRSPEYFCDASQANCETGHEGCTLDRLSKAICDKVTYNADLDAHYQYFENGAVGGFDSTADYCPYYTERPDGNCLYDLGQAQIYGEIISTASRCFESNVAPIPVANGNSLEYAGPLSSCGVPMATRCHRQECLTKTGEVRVYVSETDYLRCPMEGGVVDVHDAVVSEMGVTCSDDPTFEVEAGKDCAWLAANDDNCLNYGTPEAQTACPVACNTCVGYQGTMTCPPASAFDCTDIEPPTFTITSLVANGEVTTQEPVVFTITSDEPLDVDTIPVALINCQYGELVKLSSTVFSLSCAAAHQQDISVTILPGTVSDPNGLVNTETTSFSVSSLDTSAPVISMSARYINISYTYEDMEVFENVTMNVTSNVTADNETLTNVTEGTSSSIVSVVAYYNASYIDNETYFHLDYVPTNAPLRFELEIPEDGTLNFPLSVNCDEVGRGMLQDSPPIMYIDCEWSSFSVGVTGEAIDADNSTLISTQEMTLLLVTPTPTPTPDGTTSGVRASIIIFGLDLSDFDSGLFASAIGATYDLVFAQNVTVLGSEFYPPDGVQVDFLISALFAADADAIQAQMASTSPTVLAAALSDAFNLTLVASNTSITDGLVFECNAGNVVNNSLTVCFGFPGDVCNYTCSSGTVAGGEHVCYSNRSFVGGSCTVPEIPKKEESFFDKYKLYIFAAAAAIGLVLFCCCWYVFLKKCCLSSDK